jgi:hypothetical protein
VLLHVSLTGMITLLESSQPNGMLW